MNPQRTEAREHRREEAADDFIPVLAMLIICYVLFAVTEAGWARVVVGLLYLTSLVVAVRAAQPTPRQKRILVVALVLSSLAAALCYTVLHIDDATGLTNVLLVVVLVFTLSVVVGRVMRHRTVTVQTLAGALSAYMLIGMAFTSIYGVIAWLSPDPFFSSGVVETVPELQYFSFTTLTTLGYGDFTAALPSGRGMATFEALVGQIFLATLVASLVGSFRSHRDAMSADS